MTKIKKIIALLMVIAVSASIMVVGTVGVSAKDTSIKKTAASSETTETGITVHYKSEGVTPYVYYWNSLPNNIKTEYPGEQMAADKDNWYTTTFKDVTKINLMFTDKDGKQLSKELTRKTGEWWFYNNIWWSSNPDEFDPASSVDFREESIYFVVTTRFYNGDKSNDVHCWDDNVYNNPDSDPAWRGDFKGLADKLDYIKALGFSAIWITPIVENGSGYDYHGYHAMDFSKVDARYESDDFTYEDLIQAAHMKGMKIVQDVVWQHTGNFGEGTLCKLFDKDTSKDLGSIEDSMIPTQELLNQAGVSTAEEYWSLTPAKQHDARINLMKNNSIQDSNSTGVHPSTKDYSDGKLSKSTVYNPNNYYHTSYFRNLNWDDWSCKYGQIAGDCVDLNTENPAVAEYINQAYSKYMAMGVDAFRVDTVRHIPRLTLNMMYNKQMMANAAKYGNPNFYMFGEICTRYGQIWYRGHAQESSMFYTWDESDPKWAKEWSSGSDLESINNNMNLTFDHYEEYDDTSIQPTSDNAFLKGISYHTPDTSKASGMNAIDFTMHYNFNTAGNAYGLAKQEDPYFNDATWNVVYVDSHDYAPGPNDAVRFNGGTSVWAENLDLMFTFRGIPCIYYGSEIEFKKGIMIDGGANKTPLEGTGRAYFGDNVEGDVETTDFGDYKASGAASESLSYPLAKHITKLNKIRRAVPALQKGQYTVDSNYVSGDMAYIRRYTSDDTDSLALVTITSGATFKNIPNGTYIDAVTGDKKVVTNGTLSVSAPGKSNMRVYVCCANGFTGIDGAIGETGLTYLK